jgi:CRP/FNR family nitrogen fixation transcriptional regulator
MSMQEALRVNSLRRVVMFPPRWSSHACSYSDLVEPTGAPLPVRRDVEIYGESEPAEHLYMVVSGAVRTYKVLVDGRRQICAFHLPGDFFGLETGETHSFSAEAVTSSKVLAIKRRAVMALAQHDNEVARQLWTMTGAELRRMQAHVLLLIKTAKERVAAFLLEMAERTGTLDEVDLPMSRQDIADYLGLTIETVSRTLTDLENAATIALPSSRRVVLRDRDVLCRCG